MKKHQRDRQGRAIQWKHSRFAWRWRKCCAVSNVLSAQVMAAGIVQINIIRCSPGLAVERTTAMALAAVKTAKAAAKAKKDFMVKAGYE